MTINREKVLLTIPVRFDGEAVKPSEIATKDIGKNVPVLHSFISNRSVLRGMQAR